MKPTERILDPIHGLIRFDSANPTDRLAWDLINAPEFQRLRRIRQLGLAELVFPGASHSRFSHAIGAFHIARELVRIIQSRCSAEMSDPRGALLAVLLHDIGHGPLSHVFEGLLEDVGLKSTLTKHEQWSMACIGGKTKINEILKKTDPTLPEVIVEFLGKGDKTVYSTVVASHFDADRLDYLQRDRYMSGVLSGQIPFEWLLDCLEVNIKASHPYLYLNEKGLEAAEEFLEGRFRLYRALYYHKTVHAAERMLSHLIKSVIERADLPKSGPIAKFIETLRRKKRPVILAPDLKTYLDLDDRALWDEIFDLQECQDPDLADLAKRLWRRDLYKCFDLSVRSPKEPERSHFLEKIREIFPTLLEDKKTVVFLSEDDRDVYKKMFIAPSKDQEPDDIRRVSSLAKNFEQLELDRLFVKNRGELKKIEKLWRETHKSKG